MNVSVLIDEVRNRPILWDKTHPRFSDRHLKKNEWIKISNALGIVISDEAERQWNYLRKSFFNHKIRKTGYTGDVYIPHMQENNLSFLDQV